MATQLANPQTIQRDEITASVHDILVALNKLGCHVDDETFENTPARVMRAWVEMTAGCRQSPKQILAKTSAADCDEMVVVGNLAFASTCAHHLLPFTGTAAIGYIPAGHVVGLSKIPRLLYCFSRRLQIQEQLTQQIADAIERNLKPKGVGVVMRGVHSCMALRGVRAHGDMTTCALRGNFKTDPSARAEFLSLAHGQIK